MSSAEWVTFALGLLTLLGGMFVSVAVISRRFGEVATKVDAVRDGMKGHSEWLTKVEANGVETSRQLQDLRVSVAEVSGQVKSLTQLEERRRADSDRALRAAKNG